MNLPKQVKRFNYKKLNAVCNLPVIEKKHLKRLRVHEYKCQYVQFGVHGP